MWAGDFGPLKVQIKVEFVLCQSLYGVGFPRGSIDVWVYTRAGTLIRNVFASIVGSTSSLWSVFLSLEG